MPIILPIHFENPQGKHEINSDSLLVFIESYKEISESLGVNVSIQIGVPEEGGWKTNLILVVSLLGANPFIALLTGKTADEWAKSGHIHIVQAINDFITTEANALPDETPRECIRYKNKIYQQFQSDDCIDAFHLGDCLPIHRNNFDLYIRKLPDDDVFYLGKTNIEVSSPDWKGKRSWRGKIEIVEDVESSFDFDKELTGEFWESVRLDALPLHTQDVMSVQLLKRPNERVKHRVIRVLKYNEKEIDTPISDEDIPKIVSEAMPPKSKRKAIGQLDFFSSIDEGVR